MLVEQALRELLLTGAENGTLVPGSKLPTERALVERFAAPRSAVRRALESLEHEGLITRHVGRGTFVTEAATLKVDGAPADTSPAEIMQVRLLIEPQIATLAARAATSADLARIAECLDAGGVCAAADFEGFESWDARLHRAIAQAAHNGLLMNMFDVLNTARALPVWGTLKRRTSSPERRHGYHREHTAVVAACATAIRRAPPRPCGATWRTSRTTCSAATSAGGSHGRPTPDASCRRNG